MQTKNQANATDPTAVLTRTFTIDPCKIPAAPAVLIRVLRSTQADQFSPEAVGDLVRADPALLSRVTAASQTIAHARNARNETVVESISRLGSRMVRRLALGICMADFTAAPVHLYRETAKHYWLRSIMTAVAMDETDGSDDGFVAGLMHLVGVWLVCQAVPPSGVQIEARELALQAQLERLRFGVTAAEIGGHALLEWGFPPSVASAVRWQHTPWEAETPEEQTAAERLRHATQLVDVAFNVEGCLESATPDFVALARRIESRAKALERTLIAAT
jgi:HD-like signal output (HDOD) protein